jgi:putative inorganic carbon (HCO3(-)) transporter
VDIQSTSSIFRKPANERSFKRKIWELVWDQKLTNLPGMFLLLFLSLGIGIATIFYGAGAGIGILVLLLGTTALYCIVVYPKFGIIFLLILAVFVFSLIRLGLGVPWGTTVDIVEFLLMLGFFISQKKKSNWAVLKGPISTMILLWVFFNFIEVANPAAESRLAWVYTIRSVAIVMLMYFVFVFQINTVSFIRLILKLWLLLSLVGALYGFKQEFIGFSVAEDEYLHSDPSIAELLFIAGHWRKFSIYSDPVSFSYHMVVSSMLCIGLMTGPFKMWKKVILAVLAVLFISAMLFSGTRAAYVLIPSGLGLLCILKFSKKILFLGSVAFVLMGILIFIPTGNPTLQRFQSAFNPSEDASFNVRKMNQKRIQPYILTHPIGGGLGAVGVWGVRFAPHSFLAKFPPDSGYVRVAVELGWIGLFIFCCLMFTIMKVGIDNYYTIKNPELKVYCLCLLLMIFVYNIGNYPQEALVQFPANIYFSLCTAMINVVGILDRREVVRKEKAVIVV